MRVLAYWRPWYLLEPYSHLLACMDKVIGLKPMFNNELNICVWDVVIRRMARNDKSRDVWLATCLELDVFLSEKIVVMACTIWISREHSIIEAGVGAWNIRLLKKRHQIAYYIDIECFTSLREYFTHMRRSPINNVNRQCKTDMINKSWFHVLIRRNILGAVLYLWSDHFPLTFMAALHVRLFLR